jgi:hypothetical protein
MYEVNIVGDCFCCEMGGHLFALKVIHTTSGYLMDAFVGKTVICIDKNCCTSQTVKTLRPLYIYTELEAETLDVG